MKNLNQVYIALGSNKGDSFKYLQNAIDAIFIKIGTIKQISKVYKSKAVGFEGADFLNTCILVETPLNATNTLKELGAIETKLGRKRNASNTYQSRTIDLDIIFFNHEIITTKHLTIPHPEMHKRQFVLQPLQVLTKSFVHPKLNLPISKLLEDCEAKNDLQAQNIWLKNPIKKYQFKNYNYIAIEGNIGAGKTSLTNKIATDFNAKPVLERFADNPFLPKFYKNPKRYAFTLEMSFLADRYQQISDDLSQLDLFKDFIISDYDIHKSLIFSKITLPEDEFVLYRKLFYHMYKDIANPNLYVYLYQNTERLQQNIKKRARKYEENIANEYLEKINQGYLKFLKNKTEQKIKIIDISEKDFVKNRADYLWVLQQITNENES